MNRLRPLPPGESQGEACGVRDAGSGLQASDDFGKESGLGVERGRDQARW